MFRHRLVHYILITMMVLMAYLPTFTGGFVFDDNSLIRDNPYITKLQSLSSYLAQEDGIPDPRDKGEVRTGYYRPLINFTYYLDYKLWGLKAAGFRATNLVLHLFTAFILYKLLLFLSGRSEVSFWAVLLFALHPANTEAVAVIVSRNNILATLFILAALYGYLRWWKTSSPLPLTLSLLAFAGAMFSKEFGVMTLPIMFLAQRFLMSSRNYRREVESYVPYVMLAIIYFLLRNTAIDAPLSVPQDILRRLWFTPYLIAYNLKIIFFPAGLHSFSVSYPESLFSVEALGPILLIAFLAALCLTWRREGLFLFSTGALILALLPVLNLFTKASVSLIAMRWLYLPMSFAAAGVVWGGGKIGLQRRKTALVILIAIAGYFAAYSYILNLHLWHDERTFLRQEVVNFRNDLYAADYAEMLLQERNYSEAEGYFLRALKIYPHNARTYINYGALLIETGRPRDALAVLERARSLIMIHKDRGDWHNNMGVAMTHLGQYDQAYQHLSQSLELEPHSFVLHRNMAVLMSRQGRMAEAEAHLATAKRLAPSNR